MLDLSIWTLLLGVAAMSPDTVTISHHRYASDAGSRAYRVAAPSRPTTGPRPVLLVLHGCLQSADDIARGTRFDRRAAEERGWIVVYPEQAVGDHPNRCWNWYDAAHQRRGAGEPAILLGILDEVTTRLGGDRGRTFLVGISAGGGMAANLVALYPERFTAFGVHSGVPALAASDLATALKVMKATDGRATDDAAEAVLRAMGEGARAMPLLVLHGATDASVSPDNADRLVMQFLGLAAMLQTDVPVRRTIIPELGHAWSGGDPSGSFTNAATPDATALFLDFFASLPRR